MLSPRFVGPSLLLLCALTACGPSDLRETVCAEVSCGAGRCVLDGTAAACLCDEGFHAEGLSCLPGAVANPCEADPCANQQRSVCSVVEGNAVCGCPAGHAPVGESSCDAQPAFNCNDRPGGSGGDSAEPDSCPSLAPGLTNGVEAQRTLAPQGDTDWFTLNTQVGHIYQVTTRSQEVGLLVDVMSADGFRSVAFDHLGGAVISVSFRADDPAGHVLKVSALEGGLTGSYSVLVTELGQDDLPDTASGATEVALGTRLLGSLQFAGDADVIKVSLSSGRSYEIVASADSTSAASLVLELLSADGALLLRRSTGNPATLQPLLSVGGLHAVRVRSGTGQALGSYSLEVRELGIDDHGNVPSDATALSFGAATSGTLERGTDRDVFSVEVQAGSAYYFRCYNSSYGACRLRALLADGTVLKERNESGYDLELAIRAPAAGRLYFEVTGQEQGTSYQVASSDLGADDHGDTLESATAIAFADAPTGAALLAYGDVDTFSFPVVTGRIYRFSCSSQYGLTCLVRLKSAAGEVLVNVSGSYYDGVTAGYEATFSGTLFAEVSSDGAYGRGQYTFRVQEVGPDDHGDQPATATAIVPGGTATSANFEMAGDVDVFSFDAVASHSYQFTCSPSASISCWLRLRDPSGELLATTENAYNRVLAYEITTSGRYTVEVFNSASGNGTNYGSYTYRLSDLGADDHGDAPAGATDLSAGAAAAGVLETYPDVDVFRITAPATHVVRFTCTRSGSSGTCYLRLKSSSGALLESGRGTVSHEAGVSAATLYVEVYGETYDSLYAYNYLLEDLGQDDHGDTAPTATPLVAGAGPAAGQLETLSDVDMFSFPVTVGGLYRVECQWNSGGCSIKIRNQAGTLLREAYGTTEWESTEGGTLFVELVAGGYYRGSYTVRLTDLGLDDHGDSVASATVLTLGVTVDGSMEINGDVDAFVVTLEAGVNHQLLAPSGFVFASMRAPDGTLTLSDSSLDSNPRLFTTTVAGEYLVLVRRYYSSSTTYQLLVR